MLATATPREAGSDQALCPVCGERTGHRVFTDATWKRDIFKCEDCTAVFVSPPVEQDFTDVPPSYFQMEASESDKQAADFWFTYVRSKTGRKIFGAPDGGGKDG